ncbi:hypothetical protein F5883DRAFT_662798 [Diaporthe sp. PMI_573]|nr:hypothetical protein F5883DRAFT_662798 [Diaporthaceae sp. PMI_573]
MTIAITSDHSDPRFTKWSEINDKQFRPCDGLGNWFTDIDIENSKFCFENTAYLYVQWGNNEVHTDFFNVKGMDSLQNDVGIDGLGVAFSSMQTEKNAENWFEFNPSNFWKDFIADPRGRDRKQPKDVPSSVNKQHLRTVYKGTIEYEVITSDAKCEGNSSHAQQAFRMSWAYGLILLGDDLAGELWMKPCQNCMYHSMGLTFDQV